MQNRFQNFSSQVWRKASESSEKNACKNGPTLRDQEPVAVFLWKALRSFVFPRLWWQGQQHYWEAHRCLSSIEQKWQEAMLLQSRGPWWQWGWGPEGQAGGSTQPSEGRWDNYLNWQAVWNCCQETLNLRDLPIWLREHGVIKGKRDGQAANISLRTGNKNKSRMGRQKDEVSCPKEQSPSLSQLPELSQFSNRDSITWRRRTLSNHSIRT